MRRSTLTLCALLAISPLGCEQIKKIKASVQAALDRRRGRTPAPATPPRDTTKHPTPAGAAAPVAGAPTPAAKTPQPVAGGPTPPPRLPPVGGGLTQPVPRVPPVGRGGPHHSPGPWA